MSVADAVRLAWLNGLSNSTGERSWNTDKLFAPRCVTVNSYSPGVATLYVANAMNGVNYYAHEADRFAAAAFESMLTPAVTGSLPRSYGWQLIQTYYSAFFAAHALLRIGGWACARLTAGNLKNINGEIRSIYGGDSLPGGIYLLKCSDGGSTIDLKNLAGTGGGSHEALWAVFPTYLSHLRTTAIAEPAISAQDIQLIENIDNFITSKGGPEWFSTVRNRLNYSHSYGAWHPYTKSTVPPQNITLAIGSWLDDAQSVVLSHGTDELMHFARGCAAIVALCRMTMEDVVFRSRANSPFRFSTAKLIAEAKKP